ncbi:esterase, PHB depolymerase family [Roseateles sp. YR242]|uniref:extracellular catalytic domain type 1 short-chain-length polyhydroxyalkanoate depolymerase n=1 Tax=Roseateles sp. YR242 TaxID=1855305 RepID=UPI0008BDCC5C|nr:PHB depolymerase family esterase [Roseateles sp. YR242]SEL26887.1 esterase, PHB depolymerase family [Roseateles sp. YR242]
MMNPDFQRLMSRAAQQTRGGDLLGATASIQSALSGAPAPDAAQSDVIDVEARVVEDHVAEIGVAHGLRPWPAEAEVADVQDVVLEEERFLDATYARGRVSIDYKLYIPPGDPSVARPLLLMLHGCTQDPDDFAAGTRMNEVAKRNGWLVLYPEQSTKSNPHGCWNWFKTSHQERGRGEPALLSALTQHVMATHQVDARRVHVAGLSAGGAMAAVLGQTYPELFASVGVHSGLPAGVVANASEALAMMRSGETMSPLGQASRTPRRPVPTIVFHGTRDMTVHPVNGEQVFADATAGLECTQRVEHGREGGRAYTRKICAAPDGRSLAELWLIEGAGHAWSGGDQRGSHADWQGPDAASQMICFFSAHPSAGGA